MYLEFTLFSEEEKVLFVFCTFGVVTSINTSICYTVPVILSTIKVHVSHTNLKLLEKKCTKQSRIEKSHSPSISCFDPKTSFSYLSETNSPLRLGLNSYISYQGLCYSLKSLKSPGI